MRRRRRPISHLWGLIRGVRIGVGDLYPAGVNGPVALRLHFQGLPAQYRPISGLSRCTKTIASVIYIPPERK